MHLGFSRRPSDTVAVAWSSLIVIGVVIGINNLSAALALGGLGHGHRRWRIVGIFTAFEFTVPLIEAILGAALAQVVSGRLPWLGGSLLATTGSRDGVRARVTGLTVDLPLGSALTPVIDLGGGESLGRQVMTDPDGSFTWQRHVRAERTLTLRFGYGDDSVVGFVTESNTLELSGRAAATIVITGERDRVRKRDKVRVEGMTEGVPERTRLRATLNLGKGPKTGTSKPLVADDGSFTWQRRLRADQTLRVRFSWGDVRSNTLRL